MKRFRVFRAPLQASNTSTVFRIYRETLSAFFVRRFNIGVAIPHQSRRSEYTWEFRSR
ncbi:hypothetical protein ABLN72_05460 [Mycobacterium tuberculosis]